MKKTLIILIVGVCSLCMGVSFADSDLSKELSALTEQILAKSARPFTKLEELKKLFSHCAEHHTDPALKIACQSWLDKSYPTFKISPIRQVEIRLAETDMFHIKKLSYKDFATAAGSPNLVEKGFRYELQLPEYKAKIQFPIQSRAITIKDLSQWDWIQSGTLVIPPYNRDGSKSRSFFFEKFALLTSEMLTPKSSLSDVSRAYQQAYEYVFQLDDWKNYEVLRRKAYDESNSKRLSSEQIKDWDQLLDYLLKGSNLPLLSNEQSNLY